jgi:hypothetical protein
VIDKPQNNQYTGALLTPGITMQKAYTGNNTKPAAVRIIQGRGSKRILGLNLLLLERECPRYTRAVPGTIYIFEVSGYYKIGYTSRDIRQRLSETQKDNPLPVNLIYWSGDVEDAKQLEENLHWLYRSKRVRGEWFDLTQQDIEDIQKLVWDRQ